MKLKDATIYLSGPAGIATILVTMLVAVGFAQVLVVESAGELRRLGRISGETSRKAKTAPPKTVVSPEEKRLKRIRAAAKEFLPDGTVHLVNVIRNTPRFAYAYVPGAQEVIEVSNVSGELLFKGERKDLPFKYVTWAKRIRYHPHDAPGQEVKLLGMIGGEFSRWLMIPVVSPDEDRPDRGRIIRYWRYDPGEQIFVGYNWWGERVGYAGADGAKETADQARPFGKLRFMTAWTPLDSLSPVVFWVTEQRLYQIDFKKDSVETLFETGDRKLVSLAASNWRGLNASEAGSRPVICLGTSDGRYEILCEQPHQQISLDRPSEFLENQTLIGVAGQKLFLYKVGADGGLRPNLGTQREQWLEKYRYRPYKKWVELHEITPAGKTRLINRYEWIAAPWQRSYRRAVHTAMQARSFRDKVRSGVMGTSSPLYRLAWDWYYSDARARRSYKTTNILLADVLEELRPRDTTINLIVGLILVVIACRHGWARRTSWARFAFWIVLVAAFNLAGLLTYLAMNHTAMVRCPACGRKRGLQTPICRACNTPLPPPKPRDTDLILTT